MAKRETLDIESDKDPLRQPASAPTLFQIIDRHIAETDSHTKFYGMFTLFTTLIVIGMSIYVVHYKELRTSGQVLVNDDGKPLATAASEKLIGLDWKSLDDNALAHLKRVNLKTTNGDTVGWNVIAYEKRVADGIIVIHGPDSRLLTITDGSPEAAAKARSHPSNGVPTNVTSASGSNRRRLVYTDKHGRRQLTTGHVVVKDSASSASAQDTALDKDSNNQVPWDQAVAAWTYGPRLMKDIKVEGKSKDKYPSRPCQGLKNEYWSDPNQETCGGRPTNGQYPESYLNKWAYRGEDCSAKPCFNFAANLAVPLAEDYKGTAAFQQDFPGTSYTGRMGENGYSGGAPGLLERLACVGRTTYVVSEA